jgi:hypothetical protein
MDHIIVPIAEFQLDLAQLTYTGEDLVRPESVLAQPDGTLWVSDGRGGITRINPDGTQNFLDGLGGEPNGLAMLADGSLLVANIAGSAVQRMYGGKSDAKWVNLLIERLATVLPQSQTQEFPKLNHFGIDKQDPREVARAVSAYFLKEQVTH